MNVTRAAFAAVGAFVVYFLLGGLFFAVGPLRNEYAKYPTIYRSQDGIRSVMPFGMLAMLIAMFALAVLYAMAYKGGPGWLEGAHFGLLIGVFAVCSFVIHNYVNLNIGLRLTIGQAVAYFLEWIAVGLVIGLIYRR